MPLRTSTASNYARLLMGLRYNQSTLLRAQEQAATGRSILRPSDDAVGAARSIGLTRRIASVDRFHAAAVTAQGRLDQGGGALQEGSGLLANARQLLLQGMNGTLSQKDRDAVAAELEVIRAELIDLANRQVGDRFLFGGTESSVPPWAQVDGRAVYQGNDEELRVQVGSDVAIALGVPGSWIFGKSEPSGTVFAGLTGVAGGTTADEGQGYESLVLRHDATDPGGIAAAGLALVAGGANDTLLGANALVVDAAAGTVQLGDGPPVNIPAPSDPAAADVAVANGKGGFLHLDFSAWNGADHTDTVTGEGSIALDGATFTPLTFTETDLELKSAATGNVVHVDTTGVLRAGVELVTFGGAANVFDTLQGIADDLKNGDDLASSEMLDRLSVRLGELDRNAENLVGAMGVLGSRSARVQAAQERLQGVDLQLQELLSDTRDADLSEAVTTMVRAEQTLQIAQATGVRLIQTSLLNFLR